MPNLYDRIYLGSPIWLQQWLVAVYGWHWYHRRFGGKFPELLQQYKERDHWTAEQFREYQELQLGKILQAAWQSPYYKQIFLDAGISQETPPLEALSKLPLLSKETLRKYPENLLTQKPPKDVKIFLSSGSTGTPTKHYYTRDFHALELAVPAARNFGWAGVDYSARRVMFGVRKICRFDQDKPPFWRFSPAEDMAYASIYHLSPQNLPAYLSFLREFHPDVIMGSPSALSIIARYALEKNDLPTPVQAIFNTSEAVGDRERELIERAWQSKIWARYGAVENCMFASQCEYGRFHVSPEVGILEIIDAKGQPAPAGVMGEMICTGLNNYLQPLIRYQIGDMASWAVDQNCSCGRQMPILEAIEGRVEDICFTTDGRQLLRFDPVFKGIENIYEAQVVQEELGRFSILVVPGPGFDETVVDKLTENMRLHVGNVVIDVIPVENIPRTTGGKFRAVICNLPKEVKERLRQEIR